MAAKSGTAHMRAASAAEIAAEIERTRVRLSHTLAALDREYAVRHLVVRAVRAVEGAEPGAGQAVAGLRRNVVPLSLIGLGIGWLLYADHGPGAPLVRLVPEILARLHGIATGLGELLGLAERAAANPPSSAGVN